MLASVLSRLAELAPKAAATRIKLPQQSAANGRYPLEHALLSGGGIIALYAAEQLKPLLLSHPVAWLAGNMGNCREVHASRQGADGGGR